MDNVAVQILGGALGGCLTLALTRLLSEGRRLAFLALLLGIAAGAYFGAAFSDNRNIPVQTAAALAFALAGTWGVWAPRLLGLAWALHGLWDVVCGTTSLKVPLPAWYAYACMGYDLVVGAWVFLRGSRWGAGA